MQQPLVAVRVKDGIFVGNATSSQDDDFLFLNKVSHIINCAAAETPNLYQQAGVSYLSFPWRDCASTVLFDDQDRTVAQIYNFIEKVLDKGECVLVHSRDGTSRCCAVVAAYLMLKFGWAFENTMAFIASAHPDMDVKPYFMRQLKAYAKKHQLEMDIFSAGVDVSRLALDNEQWVLRNTYFNSLSYQHPQNGKLRKAVLDHEAHRPPHHKPQRVLFSDTRKTTDIAAATVPVIPRSLPSGRKIPTPILSKKVGRNPHPLVTDISEIPSTLIAKPAPVPTLTPRGTTMPSQPSQPPRLQPTTPASQPPVQASIPAPSVTQTQPVQPPQLAPQQPQQPQQPQPTQQQLVWQQQQLQQHLQQLQQYTSSQLTTMPQTPVVATKPMAHTSQLSLPSTPASSLTSLSMTSTPQLTPKPALPTQSLTATPSTATSYQIINPNLLRSATTPTPAAAIAPQPAPAPPSTGPAQSTARQSPGARKVAPASPFVLSSHPRKGSPLPQRDEKPAAPAPAAAPPAPIAVHSSSGGSGSGVSQLAQLAMQQYLDGQAKGARTGTPTKQRRTHSPTTYSNQTLGFGPSSVRSSPTNKSRPQSPMTGRSHSPLTQPQHHPHHHHSHQSPSLLGSFTPLAQIGSPTTAGQRSVSSPQIVTSSQHDDARRKPLRKPSKPREAEPPKPPDSRLLRPTASFLRKTSRV